MTAFLVGVAGGSASGKTTFVKRLARSLAPTSVAIVAHDAYYHDLSHLPLAERRAVNVDHPDSLETDLFVEELERLVRGESIRPPDYDFASQTRRPGGVLVSPAEVVVVEGLFVLSDTRIRERLDFKVFVATTETQRLDRRVERDSRERGKSAGVVRGEHDSRVEPMHRAHVEPSRSWADFVVEEGGWNDHALGIAVSRIRLLVDRL